MPVAAKMRATESKVPSPPRTMTRCGLVRGQLCAIDCACSVGIAGAFTVEQRLVIVLAEPADQFGKQLGEFLPSWLGDNRYACHAVSV